LWVNKTLDTPFISKQEREEKILWLAMVKNNANSFVPNTNQVMIPKESTQVQKHRLYNQDTTLHFESFYNSNYFFKKW
jgi:hypothetical protein